MRLEIVTGDGVIVQLTEMGAGSSNDRRAPKLRGLHTCIHKTVVRKGAHVKHVGIDLSQCGGEPWDTKSRRPELGFPAPVGQQSNEAGGTAPPASVADAEAAHGDPIHYE